MVGRATIAERARRSGVSKGTVSRALNGYRDGLGERLGAGGYDPALVAFGDYSLESGAATQALIARMEGGGAGRTTIPVELMVPASTAPQSAA